MRAERIGWAVRYSDGLVITDRTRPGAEANAARLALGHTWEILERWIAPAGYVESLEAERDELRATVERYREALESIIERTEDYDDGDWGFEGMPGDTVAGIDNAARRALNPGESHEQD